MDVDGLSSDVFRATDPYRCAMCGGTEAADSSYLQRLDILVQLVNILPLYALLLVNWALNVDRTSFLRVLYHVI